MKTILTTLLLLLLFFIPVARVSAQTDPGVPPQPTPLLEGIDWDEWLLGIFSTPTPLLEGIDWDEWLLSLGS